MRSLSSWSLQKAHTHHIPINGDGIFGQNMQRFQLILSNPARWNTTVAL